jgi:hypothetical protein
MNSASLRAVVHFHVCGEAGITLSVNDRELFVALCFFCLCACFRRVYKDGLAKELLAKSQAALKAAELAYQAGKDDEAKKVLADAGETFEQVGVFPDSKVRARISASLLPYL